MQDQLTTSVNMISVQIWVTKNVRFERKQPLLNSIHHSEIKLYICTLVILNAIRYSKWVLLYLCACMSWQNHYVNAVFTRLVCAFCFCFLEKQRLF